MPYGYIPYTTIKDKDEKRLRKRISEMEGRGYELIASQKQFDGYNGVVHYAKLKNTREPK